MTNGDYRALRPYFPSLKQEYASWEFLCFSRQDYAGQVPLDCEDLIMLQLSDGEQGCVCEMGIGWHRIGTDRVNPRFECFDDAWPMMQTPTFAKLVRSLLKVKPNRLTPDEVSRVLIKNGFRDRSDRPLPELGGGDK